jgi:hypothetical protein
VGAVTLEFPDLDGRELALPDGGDAWLDVPGGAPDGYLRYRDDAFALDFTLPADLPVTGSTAAVLALSVSDLAQMALDADPATAADWANGHWVRLEDATGSENDIGGIDCSFTPFVAADEGAAAPTAKAVCAAAAPPPSGGGGGGGGALDPTGAGMALVLLVHIRLRARSRSADRAQRRISVARGSPLSCDRAR